MQPRKIYFVWVFLGSGEGFNDSFVPSQEISEPVSHFS